MDVCVYEASHGFEGQLLLDLLQQAGFDAEMRGAMLGGAVGQLPAFGLVQLRVPTAQAEAARQLVARWHAGDFSL